MSSIVLGSLLVSVCVNIMWNLIPVENDVHVDGVRPRLWTAASNEPIFHPPDDTWEWNDTWGGLRPKNTQKNLSQCRFVHHKPQMDWPGRELEPPR
jgi:hypothetical protein